MDRTLVTDQTLTGRAVQLNRLVVDLSTALKQIPTQTALEIFIQCAATAATKTVNSKAKSIQQLARWAGKQSWRIRKSGIVPVACEDSQRIIEAIRLLPENLSTAVNRFLSLKPGEQVNELGSLILTLTIFFAVAGGMDLEGGAPDLDIAVQGIGMHRNVFSHSIFLGIGLEFSARFALELFKKILPVLPSSRYARWDKVAEFINKNEERSLAAIWAGIGAHLFKDSALIMGGFKSYSGLPVSMPGSLHQGLYAANGIACEAFALNSRRHQHI